MIALSKIENMAAHHRCGTDNNKLIPWIFERRNEIKIDLYLKWVVRCDIVQFDAIQRNYSTSLTKKETFKCRKIFLDARSCLHSNCPDRYIRFHSCVYLCRIEQTHAVKAFNFGILFFE